MKIDQRYRSIRYLTEKLASLKKQTARHALEYAVQDALSRGVETVLHDVRTSPELDEQIPRGVLSEADQLDVSYAVEDALEGILSKAREVAAKGGIGS